MVGEPEALGSESGNHHSRIIRCHYGVDGSPVGEFHDGLSGRLRLRTVDPDEPLAEIERRIFLRGNRQLDPHRVGGGDEIGSAI